MKEVVAKIKPNVIILAVLLAAVAFVALFVTQTVTDDLIESEFAKGVAWGTVITLFVSIIAMAVSGIVAALTAPDPPAPAVPASVVIEMMKASNDVRD